MAIFDDLIKGSKKAKPTLDNVFKSLEKIEKEMKLIDSLGKKGFKGFKELKSGKSFSLKDYVKNMNFPSFSEFKRRQDMLKEGFKSVMKDMPSIHKKELFGGLNEIQSGEEAGFNFLDLITSSFSKKFKIIGDSLKQLGKIKTDLGAAGFLEGMSQNMIKSLLPLKGAFKGLSLVIKLVFKNLIASLGPLIPIVIAVMVAVKALTSAWKVNAGGMQTMTNVLRGKFQRGIARINLAFLKLGRQLGPIIKPLVDFVGLIGGGLIDAIVWLIEGFTNLITIIMSFSNIVQGTFTLIFASLFELLNPFLRLIGLGSVADAITQRKQAGTEQLQTGMQGLQSTLNPGGPQNTQNNNITFNVSGSSMNEDAYIVFANKILGVIGQ